jgi:secreted trypsin-like serine protease
MKKLLSVFLAACLSFAPLQALAIEGGKDASGHSRIVAIYVGAQNERYDGCSGFLYAPRIVITAAHCIFRPSSQQRIRDSKIYVGRPGRVIQTKQRQIQAQKIFMPEGYKNERFDGLYNNEDFAIIVTKHIVARVSSAIPISEQELKDLHSNFGKVLVGGYGFSSERERYQNRNGIKYPRMLELELAPLEHVQKFRLADPIEKYGWAMTNPTVGSTCDGDSGAGFFIERGKETVYVGLNAWPIGSPNCWNKNGWIEFGGINRIDPIYNHTDLLNKALEYELKFRR